MVKGFKIPFRQNPYQTCPTVTITAQASELILNQEVPKLLQTGAIFQMAFSMQGRVLQPTFLNSQEGRHQAPCDRLKHIKHVCGKQSF